MHEIIKFNPWFLQAGILDLEDWERISESLKRAHGRGEKVSSKLFSFWLFVRSVLGPINPAPSKAPVLEQQGKMMIEKKKQMESKAKNHSMILYFSVL